MSAGLERQPYAASSRMSVIARYQKILNEGMNRNISLPRSGPWKHRIINQRKELPVYRGRYVVTYIHLPPFGPCLHQPCGLGNPPVEILRKRKYSWQVQSAELMSASNPHNRHMTAAHHVE